MAFMLNNVVPWGRTMEEYVSMFNLSESDLRLNIAGFGDGPASFNAEATENGFKVVSFDPVYGFSKEEIQNRINETKEIVARQMFENRDNYNWHNIKSVDDLVNRRMSAMNKFLSDFDIGKKEKRYIRHKLPEQTDFKDNNFDIGLSSHFLLMYKELGYEFHISSINEMLRICKEVRITPVVDLDGNPTELTNQVMDYYSKNYNVNIVKTDYDFLKNGDKMLVINRRQL